MEEDLLLSLILFLSALIHGLVGFAFALTALPLLALVKSVKFSVPLLAFYSFSVNFITLLMIREREIFKLPLRFFFFILLGVFIGVYGFKIFSELTLRVLLFIAIFSYFLWELYAKLTAKEEHFLSHIDPYTFKEPKGLMVAFLVGLLGGILNTPGPPIVIYLSLLRFRKDIFKATLQVIFMITSLFAILNHLYRGNITLEIFKTFLLHLPGVVIGLYIGQRFYTKISTKTYYYLVNIFLLISALLLLLKIH